MIEISHVTFSYGQSIILYDISLTIQPQSITAIIGLNGAGKSTLFNCLSKQSEIQDGKIVVDGKDIVDYSFKEYAKIVSVVPQLTSIRPIDYKVRDFMVEGRTPYLSAFAVPGLADYNFSGEVAKKMEVDKYLDKEFSKISGGEQQIVLLARALVQDTPIILLDEPMSALDLRNQAFLLKMIKKLSLEGKTILFSTHNPNHALTLDCNVCIIHDHKVLRYGTATNVLTTDVIREIYGLDACIYENKGRKFCEVSPI